MWYKCLYYNRNGFGSLQESGFERTFNWWCWYTFAVELTACPVFHVRGRREFEGGWGLEWMTSQ